MNDLLVGGFQNCCIGLLSSKVTVRSKNSEKLSQYLCSSNVVEAINKSNVFTWDSALYYVNAFLLKEAEKLYEDEQKKSVSEYTYFKIKTYGDLLLDFVKIANRGAFRLQVSKLIECVETCFNSKCISKHFSKTYTLLLRDKILSESYYWGKMTSAEWLRLYNILKQLIKKPINEPEEIHYVECLCLLIKWGPLHSFPGIALRSEFGFMQELCTKLSGHETAIHEKILQLLTEFCKNAAKDCRMACCKLGELTFYKVEALYSTNSLDRVKLLIFEYFLLQMNLHHPKGALEGTSLALAACWHTWYKQLKTLNQILCQEVDTHLCTRIRNNGLIITKNEHKTIHQSFVNLMVEVHRQVLSIKENDLAGTSMETIKKKQKLESGIDSLIESIQNKRNWQWVNIITYLLKRYPELITCNEFTRLLQVLSEIQVECKDADMRYHLYECLIVLTDVQSHLNAVYLDTITVDSLWSIIWESTLRAAGLNQNESQTNKLLQKLIILNYKLRQSSEVFRAYFSGVLKISEHSLSTLEVACHYCPLPEEIPQFPAQQIEPAKLTLLKLLLAKENCPRIFTCDIFARVCVSLVLRKFPKCPPLQPQHNYNDLEKLYEATCLEGGLLVKNQQMNHCESRVLNSQIVEKLWLDELMLELVGIHNEAVADVNPETALIKLTSVVTLCFNVISYLLRFAIVKMEEVADCVLYKNLLEAMRTLTNHLGNFVTKAIKSRESNQMRNLKECLQLFEQLFESNALPEFSYRLREIIPVELLQMFFDLLTMDGNEENDNVDIIKLLVAKIITQYSCVPKSQNMCQNQIFTLEALIPDDFNAECKAHYDLALLYLAALKHCECGTLDETLIALALTVIEKICEVRDTYYDTLLTVLGVLRELYPHIVLLDSNNLRQKSVDLLHPLYDSRNSLSANILVALLDCMGVLTGLDEEFIWAKWEHKHISEEILEFVNSDYQTVRLAAVKNLVFVFEKSASTTIQTVIFYKLNEKCDKVFMIENVGDADLNEERRIDETVTRTASVMHTYGTIMAVLGVWRCKALLALLKIFHKRKLNADILKKTLKKVASHLKFTDTFELLKNYLSCIIVDWYNMTGSLDEFPFSILDCTTEREFYTLVSPLIVPLVLQETELLHLNRIATILGASVKEIVEQSFPKVMSRCLPFLAKLSVEKPPNVQQNLIELLGDERINQLLLKKTDELIVNVLQFVYDHDYFRNVLTDLQVVLLQPDFTYTVDVMNSIFDYLQDKISNGESIISFCIAKHPQFIQKILLNLTVDIYSKTVLEEKIPAFFRYTLIVDKTLPFLQTKNPMQTYLVNQIICTLLNLIRNEQDTFTQIAIAACNYLKQIILSAPSEMIEKLLVIVVNTLVPVARSISKIGDCCLDLLNYLIVDNTYVLLTAVESLDPFPEEPRFENLSKVYHTIKYDNKAVVSLEQELRQFLGTAKRTGGCSEGLKHLKKQLAENKQELKQLYQNLNKMRGFAEDAQDSILHQLICTLVKFTQSENLEVSMEAARCLGELGPADLTTLVLQTDLNTLDFKYTHFELITGKILGVFVEYIVDPDIEVVKATSSALYKVLQSKEGRSVITSQRDYGSGAIDKNRLLPFISSVKTTSASQIVIEEEYFKSRINSENLWCPSRVCGHTEWITDLVCALLGTISNSCYLPSLIPVCKVKVQFSEMLLPLLIDLFLYMSSKVYTRIICKQINYFFEKHWHLTTESKNRCTNMIPLIQASVQCMLNVVHFHRMQKSQNVTKKSSILLEVNYLHIAQAAQFCSAYFSVLLYIELWAKDQLEMVRETKGYELFATDVTELDIIYQEQDEHTRNNLHNMLRRAYTAIGETDAIHGCLFSQFFSNEHCKELGSLELLQYYDMQISQGAMFSTSHLMDSLKDCSLYQLPLLCKTEMSDTQYECLWRLSQWNEKVPNVEFEDMHNAFEKLRYFALKGLHDKDHLVYVNALENARRCVIEDLKCSSLESCKNLYSSLCKLQSLQELEDLGDGDILRVINKWKLQDEISKNEFIYVEPIRAQRITILKNFKNDELKKHLIDFHVDLAVMGRLDGSFNISRRALGDLHYVTGITQEDEHRIVFEEAQLYWASGDKLVGKQMLRQLLGMKTTDLQASVLKLYGTWVAETCSQSSHVIIRDYLEKSIEVAAASNADVCDTYNILAKFADKEYQQVLAYTKSTGFQRTIQNVERSGLKAQEKRKLQKMNDDERRAQAILDKQSRLDENKIRSTYQEKDRFLHLAVKYYLLNLEASELNNMSIFRVISLFLENRTNTCLKLMMQQHLHRIPSYKYVTILPQLVPHITMSQDDDFGGQVTSVVLRCAEEHPYHTLPLILALINANKDQEYCGSTTKTDSNRIRLNGAKFLIGKLTKNCLIENMIKVADALIELAYVKNGQGSQVEIPKSCKIRSLKNLENVLVPTINLPVNKSGHYDNVIGIRTFGSKYTPLDGVNAPKRITCQGTDGIWRQQLVKGKDDLRQDAVMQQVFTIINSFLTTNKQTKKLLIRTYKIVPLSMRSGILEWVENSIPIGDYLVGNGNPGAHAMYSKPTHYAPNACRKLIRAVAQSPNIERLKVFMDICRNFPPIFHKFFETSFPQPTVWYERKRAYMHSVATSSMCGYILGIGDRHVRNILIDKVTAEVVHIDFGIAFDQGHVLPTPETVPFRLTRDIVDGMGVSGVEGVFRRSCEKTMEVLRQNSQTIVTILEVLLYDPLYSWAVTPAEAYNRQKEELDGNVSTAHYCEEDETPSNISAERALIRLKEKLQGTEDGSATSVEGQVGKLIQQARDPENLCRLYHGWQAYL